MRKGRQTIAYPGVPDTVDFSHWQGNINLKRLHEQGVRNIIVKCTNGAHGVDPKYNRNVAMGRDLGMKVGSYHFMLSTQNPEEQADNYLNHCTTDKPGDIIDMGDFEWDMKGKHDQWQDVGGGSPRSRANAIAAMIGRFIIYLRNQGKRDFWPLVYSGSWWIETLLNTISYSGKMGQVNFGDCPFVLAEYSIFNRKYLPAPWKEKGAAIHQYLGNGVLDGVDNREHQIDFDKLLVPLETLLVPASSGQRVEPTPEPQQPIPTPVPAPAPANVIAMTSNPAYLDDLAIRHEGIMTDPGINRMDQIVLATCHQTLKTLAERAKRQQGGSQ